MRRLLEEKNYFCQCGHVKRQHEGFAYQEECTGMIEQHSNGTYFTTCPCMAFKLDNLRFLEAVSHERSI